MIRYQVQKEAYASAGVFFATRWDWVSPEFESLSEAQQWAELACGGSLRWQDASDSEYQCWAGSLPGKGGVTAIGYIPITALSDALVFGVDTPNGKTVAETVASIWAERIAQKEAAELKRERALIDMARAKLPFVLEGELIWNDDGDCVTVGIKMSDEDMTDLALSFAHAAWGDDWPDGEVALGKGRITIELVESDAGVESEGDG